MNDKRAPSSAARARLTRDQAAIVSHARAALDASIPDTDPANVTEHLGALEYHVQTLLDLIGDLTGGAP